MSDNEENTQEMGLEFGDLYNDLEEEEYPVTKTDVVDRYGDREIQHSNGSTTVEELLDGYPDEQDYETAEDVRQALLNMAGSEAVGRQRYSDRGEDIDEETTNESL